MYMRLVGDSEREVADAVVAVVDGNPFLPEWRSATRRALGPSYVDAGAVWHAEEDRAAADPNLARLGALAQALVTGWRHRLARGASFDDDDRRRYAAVATYLLYHRYEPDLWQLLARGVQERAPRRVAAYARFARDAAELFASPEAARLAIEVDVAHVFAWGFQVRRAFHHTFRQIYGGSLPAARLRAAVWQSVFTHDGPRYRRALFDRMSDVPTLIVGESGTGKELVARAIALSRYVPFDERTQTFADDAASFHAVSLAALSPTLIESELFGHRRGAFTGAAEDRAGWLETCGARGAVFLDEIGELDAAVQVKLLRVLQTRRFQRIGETRDRSFGGKVIAATNRDLAAEMHSGRFRPDLYYRLAADVVRTPALREQLADAPHDLGNLARVLAKRIAGDEEAEALARDVERVIARRLGPSYPWPGNVRELEQCVRSVLVRGDYEPAVARAASEPSAADLAAAIDAASLTADELVQRYCALAHRRFGSYQETARRLRLDRRTVKAKVDADAARVRSGEPTAT
jgi:transcriptional regulator with AAA-type ATPase domain